MPDEVRAPYGRHSVEVLGTIPDGRVLPTYYDRPVVKPSEWRWLIISYFFTGGLAGAAQVIATVVDIVGDRGDRGLVGTGRYVALTGALMSPILLIADLKVPSRWYNMLRLFRSTSPMSIGSWTLVVFGASSGLAALGQFADDIWGSPTARKFARLCGIPAALSGGLLATYTGSLLSATSTPIWAVAYRWLPAMFGASGTATATAALSLVLRRARTNHTTLRKLERLALVASIVEFLITAKVDADWQRRKVRTPLEQREFGTAYRLGAIGLGILAPLVVHLTQAVTGREMRTASVAASAAALIGGYTQRAVLIMAGKKSAERPRDYFANAQRSRVSDLSGVHT